MRSTTRSAKVVLNGLEQFERGNGFDAAGPGIVRRLEQMRSHQNWHVVLLAIRYCHNVGRKDHDVVTGMVLTGIAPEHDGGVSGVSI